MTPAGSQYGHGHMLPLTGLPIHLVAAVGLVLLFAGLVIWAVSGDV